MEPWPLRGAEDDRLLSEWPLTIRFSGAAKRLATLRAEIDGWLRGEKVPAESRVAVILAAHEAAANAVEHSRSSAEVVVRGRVVNDLVMLEVHDQGQWKAETSDDDERGRGLSLITSLVDELEIERTDAGSAIRMQLRISA